MKKKLLSLVLAGAMVASTSVSAFAATDEATYIIDGAGKEHQVDITGNVSNSRDEIVPGTISVTVPTAVSFTISKEGQFTGGDIVIKNSSEKKVEVVAKKFTDATPTSGIVLVKESELEGKVSENDKSKVHASLNLVGSASVGLVSATSDSSTGFVNADGNEINDSQSTPLGEAWNGNPLTLKLEGKVKTGSASYTAPTQALKNTFNLVLKIQKATR